MEKITNERKLLYFLLSGMLPLFFVSLYFYSQNTFEKSLSYALSDAITLAQEKNAKEYMNKQVKVLFHDAEHFYIDKEIETIQPLTSEIAKLQSILDQGYHPNEDELRKRLSYLTSGQNALSFTEGSIKSYKDFQETIETLSHPVEVSVDDLVAVLSKTEGVSLSNQNVANQNVVNQNTSTKRPHLIITECKLEKRKGLTQDLYALELKVLKREYLQ
jgi:hypothetical protein